MGCAIACCRCTDFELSALFFFFFLLYLCTGFCVWTLDLDWLRFVCRTWRFPLRLPFFDVTCFSAFRYLSVPFVRLLSRVRVMSWFCAPAHTRLVALLRWGSFCLRTSFEARLWTFGGWCWNGT
jgi:hypothetical protein